MKASMVVVCHHSSEVVAECVASFRRAGEEASVATEVVAVEQSEDEGEEGAVASLGVDRMVVRSNAGYAAGLNTGMKETSGEVVLLANPDIRFAGGSLGPLLETLGDGYDVVGPQFVWDAAGEVLFPPAEDPAPSEELRRIMRSRWQWRWQRDLAASLENEPRSDSAGGADVSSGPNPVIGHSPERLTTSTFASAYISGASSPTSVTDRSCS